MYCSVISVFLWALFLVCVFFFDYHILSVSMINSVVNSKCLDISVVDTVSVGCAVQQ